MARSKADLQLSNVDVLIVTYITDENNLTPGAKKVLRNMRRAARAGRAWEVMQGLATLHLFCQKPESVSD